MHWPNPSLPCAFRPAGMAGCAPVPPVGPGGLERGVVGWWSGPKQASGWRTGERRSILSTLAYQLGHPYPLPLVHTTNKPTRSFHTSADPFIHPSIHPSIHRQRDTMSSKRGRGGTTGAKFRMTLGLPVAAVINCAGALGACLLACLLLLSTDRSGWVGRSIDRVDCLMDALGPSGWQSGARIIHPLIDRSMTATIVSSPFIPTKHSPLVPKPPNPHDNNNINR